MVKVFGVGSIIYPNATTLHDSLHLFMCDFDRISFSTVFEEAYRIHLEYNVDVFGFQTWKNSFHLISFDILSYQKVNKILKWIRLECDFPLIGERMRDKFLTLRFGEKASKSNPIFRFSFCNHNKYVKSLWHYMLYMSFCGLHPAPSYYQFLDVGLLIIYYPTRFDTSKKFNVNEVLEHQMSKKWRITHDVSHNVFKYKAYSNLRM